MPVTNPLAFFPQGRLGRREKFYGIDASSSWTEASTSSTLPSSSSNETFRRKWNIAPSRSWRRPCRTSSGGNLIFKKALFLRRWRRDQLAKLVPGKPSQHSRMTANKAGVYLSEARLLANGQTLDGRVALATHRSSSLFLLCVRW